MIFFRNICAVRKVITIRKFQPAVDCISELYLIAFQKYFTTFLKSTKFPKSIVTNED